MYLARRPVEPAGDLVQYRVRKWPGCKPGVRVQELQKSIRAKFIAGRTAGFKDSTGIKVEPVAGLDGNLDRIVFGPSHWPITNPFSRSWLALLADLGQIKTGGCPAPAYFRMSFSRSMYTYAAVTKF